MSLKSFLFLSTILIITSCNTEKEKSPSGLSTESVEKIKNDFPVEVIRLEKEMWENRSEQGIKTLLAKYPVFANKFIRVNEYPNPEMLMKGMSQMMNHPSIDTVYQITQKVFGDFETQKTQLQIAGSNIRSFDSKFNMPPVYTFITGFGKDMMVTDSIIAVSLEFFLAEKCKYKPDFPVYIARRYRPEYVAPYIISMISTKYIRTDILDNSLVSEMIFYGKMYYFLDKMLPGTPDTIITGFRKIDMEEVTKNEDVIWAHLLENNALYETKNEITIKYIGERPNVPEIGTKCPGRIGRWLGWQIVKKYMENNDKITIQQLLAEKDAKKIFIASKYKPKQN
ncbi:MAG: hypothetical protein SFY32_15585 [Bacteroidota bacterium]|nr:hypothetical protein [Bacteroidota bacterium]